MEPEHLGKLVDKDAMRPIDRVPQGVHHAPADSGPHGDQLVHGVELRPDPVPAATDGAVDPLREKSTPMTKPDAPNRSIAATPRRASPKSPPSTVSPAEKRNDRTGIHAPGPAR